MAAGSSSAPSQREALGDAGADRGGVLADAGGEDEGVEAAEGGGEAAGVQGAAVDEVVDGEGGAGVVARQQVAHVVGDAGEALEAGGLVEEVG